MNVTVNVSYTFEAGAPAPQSTPLAERVRFATPSMSLIPLIGDHISLEEAPLSVFIVKRRHFHWMSPSHLQLDILLSQIETSA